MRAPAILTFLVVLQLIIGLSSQLLILKLIGIGWETDVFIVAQTVPTIIVALMAASLQSLWLPRFSRYRNEYKTWNKEVSSALGQTTRLMLTTCLMLLLLAGYWVELIFPGLNDEEFLLFFDLSYPLFLSSLFAVFSGILFSALRSAERFLFPEGILLGASLIGLILIYISVPVFGVVAAAWIMALKNLCVFFILMHAISWPKFELISGNSSAAVMRQMKPLLYGGILGKSGVLIDRYWGSQAAEGDVTVLAIAQLGVSSTSTILERVFLARHIPKFSIYIRDGNITQLRRTYLNGICRIFLTVIALLLILIMCRPVFTTVLNPVLDMTRAESERLWLIMLVLFPSAFSLIASGSSVAIFYAFGETKVPALIGAIGFIGSIILKAALYKEMGIIGIAVGSSVHLMSNFALHFGFALRRIKLANVKS